MEIASSDRLDSLSNSLRECESYSEMRIAISQQKIKKTQKKIENSRQRQQFLQNLTLEIKDTIQCMRQQTLNAVMEQPTQSEYEVLHSVNAIEAFISIARENRRRREVLYDKQRECDAENEIIAPTQLRDLENELCGRREAALAASAAYTRSEMAQDICHHLIDFVFLTAIHREDTAFLSSKHLIENEIWTDSLSLLGTRLSPSFSLLKELIFDENVSRVVEDTFKRYIYLKDENVTEAIENGKYVFGDMIKEAYAPIDRPPRQFIGIITFGPSKIGRKKWARGMAKRYNLALISVNKLIHKAIQQREPAGTALIEYLERGEEIPSAVYTELIIDAVDSLSRSNWNGRISGWIVDGLPCLNSHTNKLQKKMTQVDVNAPNSPLWQTSDVIEDCKIDLVIYIDGKPESVSSDIQDPSVSINILTTRQNAQEALCAFHRVIQIDLINDEQFQVFEAVDALLSHRCEISRQFDIQNSRNESFRMEIEDKRIKSLLSLEARLYQAQCTLTDQNEQLHTAEANNARKSDIAEHKAQVHASTETLNAVNNDIASWNTSQDPTLPTKALGLSAWGSMETFYVAIMKRNFGHLTLLRGRVFASINETLCNLQSSAGLWRLDRKQIILDAFQKDFNSLDGEIRLEIKTKDELHARTDMLFDALNDVVGQQQSQDEEEMDNALSNFGVDVILREVDGSVFDMMQTECFIIGNILSIFGRVVALTDTWLIIVKKWLESLPSIEITQLEEHALSTESMVRSLVEGMGGNAKLVCGIKYEHTAFCERVRKLIVIKDNLKQIISDAYEAMQRTLTDTIRTYRLEEINCIAALTQYIRFKIEAAEDLPVFIRFAVSASASLNSDR